ncbi:hypothetical protein ACS0TY_013323 [Phlomoides rotata]
MAAKKNKAKKPSTNKGVNKWQRLNIPPEIIQLLHSEKRRERSLLHDLSITCTTKWWVPTTSRCSRSGWPQFRLLGNSSNTSPASGRQKYFYGVYYIHNAANDCRQIMFYSNVERAWIRYECDTIDPFDSKKKCMEFTGVIGFQGKFYALSLQGALAVIESVNSRLAITWISTRRAVPSVSWKLFKEHLFEMNGEIFLVFFIHKKSAEMVDHVEVFRLCFDELKWIKIERFHGKTVFFDGRGCWVNSAEIGCRGDCIYFTLAQDNSWWIYDMERSCIKPATMKN